LGRAWRRQCDGWQRTAPQSLAERVAQAAQAALSPWWREAGWQPPNAGIDLDGPT
jgi:hypothetical protein